MSNILVHEETSKETRIMIPKNQLIDCLIKTISALEPRNALGDVIEYDLTAFSHTITFDNVTDIEILLTERSSN